MALRPDTSNYFRFYGLPEEFDTDAKILKEAYLEKSRTYHPDYYGNDPESQNIAVATSAFNNTAYKILSNDIRRAMYLCELNSAADEQQIALPTDFLMEMMEMNEAIDEDTDRENLTGRLDELRGELKQEIYEHARSRNWEKTRIAVAKWKYLERLESRIE